MTRAITGLTNYYTFYNQIKAYNRLHILNSANFWVCMADVGSGKGTGSVLVEGGLGLALRCLVAVGGPQGHFTSF